VEIDLHNETPKRTCLFHPTCWGTVDESDALFEYVLDHTAGESLEGHDDGKVLFNRATLDPRSAYCVECEGIVDLTRMSRQLAAEGVDIGAWRRGD
jgi:hypothetical protein